LQQNIQLWSRVCKDSQQQHNKVRSHSLVFQILAVKKLFAITLLLRFHPLLLYNQANRITLNCDTSFALHKPMETNKIMRLH